MVDSGVGAVALPASERYGVTRYKPWRGRWLAENEPFREQYARARETIVHFAEKYEKLAHAAPPYFHGQGRIPSRPPITAPIASPCRAVVGH